MSSTIDLAKKNLDNMLDWIGRFDNKSSVIMGLNLGMLGMLVSFAPEFNNWTNFMWGSTLLTLLALGLCFICIYSSNFPRTKGPEVSLFYFGSINKMECDEFQQQFTSRTEDQHLEDLLGQVHRNAQIITIKFEHLKGAYLMLIIGVIPWALTLFLFNTIPKGV